MPLEGVNLKYIPDDEELSNVKGIGNELGKILKE